MRELLTNLVLPSCLLPVLVGGMQISSSLTKASAPHVFGDLCSQPPWSSEVRHVDPNLQTYERLPAPLPTHTMMAEAKPFQRLDLSPGGASNMRQVNMAIRR